MVPKLKGLLMSKVYLNKPGWLDKQLGHANEKGDVYRSNTGIDDRIGRVDLETGKVYRRRFGPDDYVGRVELDSGKVYHARLGPDEYLGRVQADGRMYQHDLLSPDDYIGRLSPPLSPLHTGAAFLLLVLPALEDEASDQV
jgi:hypothetical protein